MGIKGPAVNLVAVAPDVTEEVLALLGDSCPFTEKQEEFKLGVG